MNTMTSSAPTIETMRSNRTGSPDKKKMIFVRKIKKPKLTLPKETEVKRCEQNKSYTILRIRFASVEQKKQSKLNEEQAFIRDEKEISEPKTPKLPFLRYKKTVSPEQQLQNMGYSPDTRIGTEIYEDKVEEKKKKFTNRMQALKQQLMNNSHLHSTRKRQQYEKSRIRVKILTQQIKRKRERQVINMEERKGKEAFKAMLLRSSSDVVNNQTTI